MKPIHPFLKHWLKCMGCGAIVVVAWLALMLLAANVTNLPIWLVGTIVFLIVTGAAAWDVYRSQCK